MGRCLLWTDVRYRQSVIERCPLWTGTCYTQMSAMTSFTAYTVWHKAYCRRELVGNKALHAVVFALFLRGLDLT